MIKDGTGHHPHSLRDPTLIADFIADSLTPPDPTPAFVGKTFTRSSFYGVEDSYSEFPSEGLFITCRGARFVDTYDRYEFKPDNTTGNAQVIVPKTATAMDVVGARNIAVAADADCEAGGALPPVGWFTVLAPTTIP